MAIKQPFSHRDLLNKHNRDVVSRVADIWDTVLGKGSPTQRDSIILEEIGGWVRQESWHDRTGFYLTIRLAPLDKTRPAVQESGRAIMARFIDAFPGRNSNGTFYEGQENYAAGENLTVYVETGMNSIGD